MWLTGWLYRRKITLQSTVSTPDGYEIRFRIGESSNTPDVDFHLDGKAALFPSGTDDSGDIRFTSSDGQTLLPLWVEKVEGTSPNRVAVVWVKVNEDLSTPVSIYCYYGNSNASNVSNGNSVFIHFDSFSADSSSLYQLVRVTDSTPVEPTWNTTDKRLDISVADNQSSILEIPTVSLQDVKVGVLANLTGAYPEGGSVVLGSRYDGKFAYLFKALLSEYSTDGTTGTQTTTASPEFLYRRLIGTLVIFSGFRNETVYTPTESVYLDPNVTTSVEFIVFNNTLIGKIADHTFTVNDDSLLQSGSVVFGFDEANGWIDYIYIAHAINPEPSITAGVEESETPEVQDTITLTDTPFVVKQFSVQDSITLTDTSDRYGKVEIEVESSYTIHEWQYSKYSILVGKTTLSPYSILVKQTDTSSYSVLVDTYTDSSYSVLISSSSESAYSVQVSTVESSPYDILIAQRCLSTYTLTVRKRIQSEYFIEEITHPTVECISKYRITDYDYLSVENESRYEVGVEGVTAVAERAALLDSTYTVHTSDRQVHLHLYNTYTTDRQLFTDVYTLFTTDRNAVVVRQLLFTTRVVVYSVYTSTPSERTSLFSGYTPEANDRSAITTAYDTKVTERKTVAENETHLYESRYCYTFCLDSTGRWCFGKAWWVSERTAVTYGIPYTPAGDQRFAHAQVSVTQTHVIRHAYTESTSYHCTVEVNPKYTTVWLQKEVTTTDIHAWSATVTTFRNAYRQLPLPARFHGIDLLLVNDATNEAVNLAQYGQITVPVYRITSNTYRFKGYLVTRHKPLHLKVEFGFDQPEHFSNPDDYYKYLVSHGYLKLTLNQKEVHDLQSEVLCVTPLTPIQLEVYMYAPIILKTELQLVWGYPYITLTPHSILLEFSPAD